MTADEPRSDVARFTQRRLAWLLGGSLLLASTIVEFTLRPMLYAVAGSEYIGTALHAAALLVFALGLRGQGSVTDLRPLGTTALVLLAVWDLLTRLIFAFVPIDPSNTGPAFAVGTVMSLAEAAIALVAVVQIGRAGVIPAPWNWAPMWALGAVAAGTAVQYLGFAAGASSQQVMGLLVGLELLIKVGAAVFLGVLAILLANRPLPTRTVSIIDTQR